MNSVDFQASWRAFRNARQNGYTGSPAQFVAKWFEVKHNFNVGDYVRDGQEFGVVIDKFDNRLLVRFAIDGLSGFRARMELEHATKEQFDHAEMMSHSENRFV